MATGQQDYLENIKVEFHRISKHCELLFFPDFFFFFDPLKMVHGPFKSEWQTGLGIGPWILSDAVDLKMVKC